MLNTDYIDSFIHKLIPDNDYSKKISADQIENLLYLDGKSEYLDSIIDKLKEMNVEIADPYAEANEVLNESSKENVADLFQTYSCYVSKIPKLSQEEERKLIKEAQEGSHESMEKLILANLSLVLSQAKQLIFNSSSKNFHNIMDQIQEGNLGLIKAIEKFDLSRDNRFSTYAVYWIRQQIRQSNQYSRPIKMPSHIADSSAKVIRAANKLEQELSRTPTPEEIADEMDFPVEKVREILIRNMNTPISLSAPIGNDSNSEGMIMEILQDRQAVDPEDEVMKKALTEQIDSALSTLDPREADILRMRFGFDGKEYTLEEVGNHFNITRERVRQIEAKALRKLRHPSRSKYLADFKA